ncbi:MAG: hypothetical protein JXP34_21010, partial [Planctomycetes bacterium]|nr:hypothetical protein [Planctomycetota bacterium]
MRAMLPALFAIAIPAAPAPAAAPADRISLRGEWAFRLDPEEVGVAERWFEKDLPDRIRLPGSTDEAGFGTAPTERDINRLTRLHRYEGSAWYAREIEIPAAWAGRRVGLFLERCHWQTRVWVDGKDLGSRDSLCVP